MGRLQYPVAPDGSLSGPITVDCYLELYKGLRVEEAFQSDGYEIESSRENYVVISRKERWLHSLAK